MKETDVLNLLTSTGLPAEAAAKLKENDMAWLTLLLTWLPKLLEFLKLILKMERDAAKAGVTSPISAAIDVLEKTGDTKPFLDAVAAAEVQEKKIPPSA